MRHMPTLIAIAAACAAAACGHVGYRANFINMGEADTQVSTTVHERYMAERSSGAVAKEEVRVLENALPEGLTLNDGVIGNKDGYSHKVIGKFDLGPNGRMFPDYVDGWRKAVCYWQVPLTWVTLAVWAIVPTFYPCFVTDLNPKEDILTEVRRVTRIAGGDLAVIEFIGTDRDDPTQAMGATGFILLLDPRLKDIELKTTPQPLGAPKTAI